MAFPLLSLLVTLGTGIASAVSSSSKKKREAAKINALTSQLQQNQIDSAAYLKKLDEIYTKLGDKTKQDIGRIFKQQGSRLKQFIQQRRIPEFLTNLKQLPKEESEAISRAMLGIEQAKLGKQIDVQNLAFQQASQVANLTSQLDRMFGGETDFSRFLKSAFQPITTFATKQLGEAFTKGMGGGASAFSPISQAIGGELT